MKEKMGYLKHNLQFSYNKAFKNAERSLRSPWDRQQSGLLQERGHQGRSKNR